MPQSRIRVHQREVRTAIRKSNLSGTFVVGKYSISPYMACEHGCSYCDGRAERYWVEGDFDRDIVVRHNLPERLAEELPRLREPGFVTIGSGITDAYQPVEHDTGITARCAEILARHHYPVTLITKSKRPLRDIDLWRRVNERARFFFIVSLVHPDDATRSLFEPGAASVEERWDALRAFKEAGCATGILAMPLLPGITDTDEALTRLYDAAAEVGVDFVQPGNLTLRPGRQKAFFFERLSEYRPDLVDYYASLFAEERPSGAPLASYAGSVMQRGLDHNRRTGIPFLVPHRIYRKHILPYDEGAVLLRHMIELYSTRGIDTRRLKTATGRYLKWLTDRKRAYNRHRSWDYHDLTAEIVAPGALEEIVSNDRLATLLRAVMEEQAVFDYVDLELRSPSSPDLRLSDPRLGGKDNASATRSQPPE